MDLCKWLLFTCFLLFPSNYTTWKIKIGTPVPVQTSSLAQAYSLCYEYTDAKTGFQEKDICIIINFKCPILQTSFNKQSRSIEVPHTVKWKKKKR